MALELFGQYFGKGSVLGAHLEQHFVHIVWHRYKMTADLFGQAFYQGYAFVPQHAWHQPFKVISGQLVQQGQWNFGADAILCMAGLKGVTELKLQAVAAHCLGKLRLFVGGQAPQHQGLFADAEQVGVISLCAFAPFFESGQIVNSLWNSLMVEAVDDFLFGQQVATPEPIFQPLQFCYQLLIG